MNRRITLTGANIVFLVFALAFMAYQVIGVILFGADVFTDNIYLTLLINELVLILGPVLIYAVAVKRVNLKETFRFNRPGVLPVVLIVLISVPAYFVAAMLNNLLVYLLQFLGNIPAQPIPIPGNIGELLFGLLIIAVLPGICEEMMHRGLLLRAYEKRGSYKAVVITSIFFGLFHFDLTNLLGPVFLGLVIGYYVIRTNSIFSGMLAHFLNNAIAELMQYFQEDKSQPQFVTVSTEELIWLLIFGCIGLAAAGFLLHIFKKATEGRAVIVPPISNAFRDFKSVFSHWPILIIVVLYFLMQLILLLSIVLLKLYGQ
jgi:membrane protease YdiL (CAAX protease family)